MSFWWVKWLCTCVTTVHSTRKKISIVTTTQINIIKESSSFHLLCQINWFSRCVITLRFNRFFPLTLFFLFSYLFVSCPTVHSFVCLLACLLSLALLLVLCFIYIWPSIGFSFAHTQPTATRQSIHSYITPIFALNIFATVLQICTNKQLPHRKWLWIWESLNKNTRRKERNPTSNLLCKEPSFRLSLSSASSRWNKVENELWILYSTFIYFPIGWMKRSSS